MMLKITNNFEEFLKKAFLISGIQLLFSALGGEPNMINQSIIVVAMLMFSANIMAADFEGALEFNAYEKEGRMRVTCINNGYIKTQTHFCNSYGLRPRMKSFFNHKPSKKVTRVVLKRKIEDDVITKRSSWDSENNRTQKKINLWIDTLLQTPLFEMGENTIEFQLYNKSELVEEGSVVAKVQDQGTYNCGDLDHTTSDLNFCNNYSQACQFYFQKQKMCF